MSHPIAPAWKPVPTSIAVPGRRLADKIRFAAGTAIVSGGAGLWLSDLIALVVAVG